VTGLAGLQCGLRVISVTAALRGVVLPRRYPSLSAAAFFPLLFWRLLFFPFSFVGCLFPPSLSAAVSPPFGGGCGFY